jgi:hypothetical protein
MYIIVYTSRYTGHCTYDKVRNIKYVDYWCHLYLLVYTIMYMLFSTDLIICTVSCIPTGIYNNVHALFKACTLLYIPVGIEDTVHMIRWEE